MWAKIITFKRTEDINYFSLCALNLFNTRVSQFELNYWNKWTFPRHSNLFRCTCILENHFASLRKRWEWKWINSHKKRLLEWSRIPLVATEYLISLKRGTRMHTVWQHVWPHAQMSAHLLLPIGCCAFAVVLWELVHPVQLSLWRWIQSTL